MRKFKFNINWYFVPKKFEISNRLYKVLQVHKFQKLVMITIGRLFKKIGMHKELGTYFIGDKRNKETIKQYELVARINEVLHLPFAILFGILVIYDVINYKYIEFVFNTLYFVINSYCVMLQRYNRVRVYTIIGVIK